MGEHVDAPAATNNFIERSTNASFTSNVVTFSVGRRRDEFVDTSNVATGTAYFYRVRAENALAYSEWSGTAKAVGVGQAGRR